MQSELFRRAETERAIKPRAVNVASVPQRSPFRYPGGKTWFVPRFREWLSSKREKPELLVEPFAGGGIISLTAAFEDLVEKALMVELDEDVAAVWQSVVDGDSEWLAKQILEFPMSQENAVQVLAKETRTVRETAFRTIIKNRTFHGGILANGSGFLKKGENGKGILSRWYPETLAKRLRDIESIRHRLLFSRCDAFVVLEKYLNARNALFFIDPPYTAGGKRAGKRLYKYFEIDHDKLFAFCQKLAGDFIMTYDNADEVKELARKYGFAAKPIPMKNTHHAAMTELVIGRNLDWMSGIERILETQACYKRRRKTRKRSVL